MPGDDAVSGWITAARAPARGRVRRRTTRIGGRLPFLLAASPALAAGLVAPSAMGSTIALAAAALIIGGVAVIVLIFALAPVFTATHGYQAVWGVCSLAVLLSLIPLRRLRGADQEEGT